jgi:glycosyltransferase involved in cell wall biosynthesis
VRVAYVLRYWPTLTETFVAREIAALREEGVEVDVVALGSRRDGALADELPDVPVIRVSGVPKPLRVWWLARIGARRGWRRLHAHFAGEAAERAMSIARALGVPFSVTVHAVDLFKPRPSLAHLLRSASPVVAISNFHVALVAERYGVEAKLLYSGIDAARFRAADPAGPGPFVCVARDVAKKNLDALVAALPVAARLRLVSDAHRLAGPRVLVGLVPSSRLPGVLARASAFALPCRAASDGDQDGVPVSLLEAMAAGLPVVTTRVAGIPEVVDDEVGWLLPPGNDTALAETLRAVAASPGERARRGAAARARMEAWPTTGAQARALVAMWHDRAT